MAALSADKQVISKGDYLLQSFKVGAGQVIYQGATVKVGADGYLKPQAAGAGAKPAGVAYEACDNSLGADGDKECRVYTKGIFQLHGAGFAITDLQAPAYASTDNDISNTKGADELAVGIIKEIVSATEVFVEIDLAPVI